MTGTTGGMTKTFRAACCALVAGLALAGCAGDDGRAGAPGAQGTAGSAGPTGPAGPSGPITAIPITSARFATALITEVTGGSRPVVTVRLVDDRGQPLRGLPASAARFTVAKLVPGAAGASAQWVSYVNRIEQPTTDVGWGTRAQRQATAEPATAAGANWVDNNDGTYTYTFARTLDAYTPADALGPAVTYDADATHRIGFEARPTGTTVENNPVYTYVPATGSTTTLPARYDVVNTAQCAACHDKLTFHGGARSEMQYCVACHNPGTVDAQSANSLDMKVMIHKIHRGIELPTVQASRPNPAAPVSPTNPPNTAPAQGRGYTIWGFGGTEYNFNAVVYSQDVQNCTTCHRESDPSTPQASNWRTVANTAACGSCHDDVNFATGAGHGTGGIATDAQCMFCHQARTPLTTAGGRSIATREAHVVPDNEAVRNFRYEVLRVEPASGTPACTPTPTVRGCRVNPGDRVRVTVRVFNPTNGTPYLLTDPAISTGRLTARIAWDTLNYTNPNNVNAQPLSINLLVGATQNPDGSITGTATTALPATASGTGAVILEGRVNVTYSAPGIPAVAVRVGVPGSAPVYFPITDTIAVARRDITDIAKCNECHFALSFHGEQRNSNDELCAVCHNPEYVGGPDQAGARPQDFKWLMHGIHAGTYRFGIFDYSDVKYPGSLANCEGCHRPDTYYPVDPARIDATTIWRGASNTTPADDLAISANVAACSGCHTSSVALMHMQQNGGVIMQGGAAGLTSANQIKTATGATVVPAETCGVCHGPGASADVKVEHRVTSFRFR